MMKPKKQNPDLYECHICGKTFQTKDELRQHIMTHIPQPAGIDPEHEFPEWEPPRHSG